MMPPPNEEELTAYSQEWLAATFTKQIFGRRQAVEPPKFRSIVQAVRASMYVDKITRKTSQAPVDVSPAAQMLTVWLHLVVLIFVRLVKRLDFAGAILASRLLN